MICDISAIRCFSVTCGYNLDLCPCRQRKLEEALLFAGQFSEALQALLDWLAKVEPTLGEDQPVYGDVFTVNNLMEIHKVSDIVLQATSLAVIYLLIAYFEI